jgi:hypothetical protein
LNINPWFSSPVTLSPWCSTHQAESRANNPMSKEMWSSNRAEQFRQHGLHSPGSNYGISLQTESETLGPGIGPYLHHESRF